MSIKPFNDRFGKVLKVITGSARLLSDQPLSIPNIGKKRDIKFSKAYKTDLFDFAVSYSANDVFYINIPKNIGGAGEYIQVRLVATMGKPGKKKIYVLHSSTASVMASRLLAAINGSSDETIVKYGFLNNRADLSRYVSGPTGFDPIKLAGDSTNGIAGIVGKIGTTNKKITVTASKYGYPGNSIVVTKSSAFAVTSGKRRPFKGGSGNVKVMNTQGINYFRQGVSVRDPSDIAGSMTPFISEKGLPNDVSIKISFETEQTMFGQHRLFKNSSSDGRISQFADIKGKFSPVDYVKHSSDIKYLEGYPVVLDNPTYNDPSFMDGVIEPLDIRSSLTNYSIFSPFPPHIVKASLHTGDFNGDEEGTSEITTTIDKRQGVSDFFEDSQEVRFGNVNFPKQSGTADGPEQRKGLSIPGYISGKTATLSPFIDDIIQRDYIPSNIVTIYKNTENKFLTGSAVRNISEIGTVYKSAVCGFQFGPTGLGDSTVLGTDSIAFGGLKR